MSGQDDARVWYKSSIQNAKTWSVPEFEDAHDAERAKAEDAPVPPAPPTAAELDALQKRAFDEAYAEGYAAGQAAGQDALDAAIARLKIIAAELAAPLDELDRDLEYSLSNLALILARRIVGRAVREDPESLHSLVQQAVEMLGRDLEAKVDVFLHPQDVSFLKETVGTGPNWILHADDALQPGDVRVKRGLAEVDGRLKQRLDRLAAEMING